MDEDILRRFDEVAATWQPPPTVAHDEITPQPAKRFAAILGVDSPVEKVGEPLPPLWHRFSMLPIYPQASLGPDGHPTDTPLTPPIGPHRRVFGGCRISFRASLLCGDEAVRRSEVTNIRTTAGRQGPLLIVTIQHTYSVEGQTRIVEEHDIVYRGPRTTEERPKPLPHIDAATPAPAEPWHLMVHPDPVLLFRYSALSQNAHRIHYDEPYTRTVEGHPALVVQGLLLALLMLELPRRYAPNRRITTLTWSARASLYVGQPVHAYGHETDDGAELIAGNSGTPQAMVASVAFAD